MKIGILTFWWSADNYGQLLQCYALQKYLRDRGHDAFLIRYDYTKDVKKHFNYFRLLKILNPYLLARYIGRKFSAKENKQLVEPDRYFELFRQKYLIQSERQFKNFEELEKNPPIADAYIVGSDQVWNCNYIDAPHSLPYRAYFLDFGNENTKRISYAASWGIEKLPKAYEKKIVPLLSRFAYVSVREKSGIDLCRKCGVENAEWICDPTLLLGAEAYRSIYRENEVRKPSRKYILLYILNNECDFDIQTVYDFANEKGLEVIYVTGNAMRDEHKKYFATIPEWLYLIDNAEYVITNSFHGAVFCTIFHKQFAIVKLSGKASSMNARFDSLFALRGTGNRYLSGTDFSVLEESYEPHEIRVSERFLESIADKEITGAKSQPVISIIVPVYKVEQYLRRCLDSIAVQTFTDWECILIDDGSPDKSGAICDEYAERDSRFRVIHQENKGVSAARNAGLDAAQGEWIGFVDSDDWIEPNMYEHLYNDALKTKADCVVCGFFGQSKRRVRKMCRTEKAVKLLFARKGFGGFSFLRLIAAEKVHNIRYDTTISYMEDVKFFYEAFKNCKSVYWDNEPLYHYEQNTTSVTHQFGLTRHAKSALKLLDDLQMSEPKKDISTAIFVDKLCFCTALAKMYIKAQETKNASFIFLQQQLYKHFFFIVFSPQISLFMKCWVIIIAFPFLSKLPFLSRYISDTDIVYNGGYKCIAISHFTASHSHSCTSPLWRCAA